MSGMTDEISKLKRNIEICREAGIEKDQLLLVKIEVLEALIMHYDYLQALIGPDADDHLRIFHYEQEVKKDGKGADCGEEPTASGGAEAEGN